MEPSQSFTTIKSDLLEALRQRGGTEINGDPLPSDPEDVIFGVPVDKNDPNKGWVGLDIPATDTEDDAGGKKKVGSKKSVLNASPLGAGLRDGAMLAFKFRSDDAQMDEDGIDLDYSNWDVVIPSYDEESTNQLQQ